MHSARKP